MTAPYVQPVNVPSKPESDGASGGRNQKDRRYQDTFWDQHRHPVRFPNGRPWNGPRELAANRDVVPPPQDGFCGALAQGQYVDDDTGRIDRTATLGAVWFAPWVPLEKYFKFNYPRKRISFDYAKMIREETAGLDEYYKAAAKLGAKLNLRVEYGVVPDFQITADLGEPTSYLTKIRVAEAAMAGDPWVLGFIDEPNPDLAKVLGYNQRGMQVLSYTPPAAVVTPAQVLATPDADLLKMIAEMAATAAAAAVDRAFERRDAEAVATKRKNRAKMDKVRSHHRRPQESAAPT